MEDYSRHARRRSLLDRFLGVIEGAPTSDRQGLRVLFFIVIATVLFLLIAVSGVFSEERGLRGGSFTEGMLGTPRFVNPALALTRTDQDMSALLYSGLLRIDTDGSLQPDLAEEIIVSDSGLQYTVRMRRDRSFHDGTPITATDVLFTIRLIQDTSLKSPLLGNWSQVTVEIVDDYNLLFSLDEAYAPFIENFTLGIMPAHIWREVPIEQLPFAPQNIEPIGSGPYQIASIKSDTTGLTESYRLTPHNQGDLTALIETINVDFFANESDLQTALTSGKIDATAHLSVESLASFNNEEWTVIEEPLPRIFGVFFNQNQSAVLRDDAARAALSASIDRQALIDTTLATYGVPSVGPTVFGTPEVESRDATSSRPILESARWTETDDGTWTKSLDGTVTPLSFTLRTSNSPLFVRVAEALASRWQADGIDVAVEQYEQNDLVQGVIRPRDFEALLFGLDMNRSQDLFPFWHSSQQDDPGLNIAQYTNITVDDLLESARVEQNSATRESILTDAADTIVTETPAVFLFQPSMVYVVDKSITLTPIVQPGQLSHRFANVHEWYIQHESIWPFFK